MPFGLLVIISIGPVDMNKYARFDEIPSLTLKDIKETKRYGRTDMKTVYPPTNTVCGGIKILASGRKRQTVDYLHVVRGETARFSAKFCGDYSAFLCKNDGCDLTI